MEQFYLMATKCSNGQRPMFFFITLSFTVLPVKIPFLDRQIFVALHNQYSLQCLPCRLIRRPLFSAITEVVPHCTRMLHAFSNMQYASISSNIVLRLVEALACVENERLAQNVGTKAVMVDGLVCRAYFHKISFESHSYSQIWPVKSQNSTKSKLNK